MTRQQEVPANVIDWQAIHGSAPFRELATRRGRFVRLAATAILGWFAVFLLLVGAAPALAGTVVVAGTTVGFLLGLSQFVLAWVLTWRYLRLSRTVFSGLEDQVVRLAAGSQPELTA
jgi:Predicted membrane protein